ncbi:hypothetical protein GCM10017600_03790 [Streptosporangium carneum]|uniref:Uncharacterized protein n=1 Tax=Streptosporangium carneum TaxID=47481 RepID=A0A9W6HWI8_9ACTN|nr:hypothetical protein GCM10017600_03790 [Streptosporangium carneum]
MTTGRRDDEDGQDKALTVVRRVLRGRDIPLRLSGRVPRTETGRRRQGIGGAASDMGDRFMHS